MTDTRRAILAMIAANGCFVANDALMKLAAAEMPVSEAVFIRGVFTCAAFAAIFVWRGERWRDWARILSTRGSLRAAAEVVASIAFLYALVGLPIADLTGILQVVPVLIAIGAARWFAAPIGPRQWLATALGLAGALAIIKPGVIPLNAYTALAILSVATIVIRDLVTRALPGNVPGLAVAASSAAAIALGGLALSQVEPWLWPAAGDIARLAAAAAFLTGALHGLVVAMRLGDIGAVGPFRYVAIVFAVALGYAVWGEWPDAWSWLGMATIVGAGLLGASERSPVARASAEVRSS
jgi:drug/metabolite transporter (DMT)-like permease